MNKPTCGQCVHLSTCSGQFTNGGICTKANTLEMSITCSIRRKNHTPYCSTCFTQKQPPKPKAETIEETVCRKIAERAERGKAKYGVTMERTDLTRKQWLQHAQEEAMDFAIYLEKLMQSKP